MKASKAIVSIFAMAALTLTVSAASFANTQIGQFSELAPQPTDFIFTGGVHTTGTTGELYTTQPLLVQASGPQTSTSQALLVFGPIYETGVATHQPIIGPNAYSASFSGGSFSIVNDAGGTPGATLLSGTFTSSSFLSTNTSSGGLSNLDLNGVAYNSADQYVQEFINVNGGGTPVNGNLSLSFTSVTPGIGLGGAGGGFAAFDAAGSGTFDATSVPEPSEYATLAIGALALVGMMAIARRRSSLQL